MVQINDYTIEQSPNHITITLPQTLKTATSTTAPVSFTRKEKLTDTELAILLVEVIKLMEVE